MTWRERIEEARERGAFTDHDIELWLEVTTCPAAEVCLAYGIGQHAPHYNVRVHGIGSKAFGDALFRRDFTAAERAIEAMEDLALQIKREARDV